MKSFLTLPIGCGALLAAAALAPAPLAADDFTPVVVFSVHDEPVDGMGDTFNGSPFEGLLRTQSTRADRAMQEFDISGLGGGTVASATITGHIANNNAGGTWPRMFDYTLYSGNGVADLSDYQIAGTVVGTSTWEQVDLPSGHPFSFDVTGAVQTLVSGGATHIGLRVSGTSANLFPSILTENTTLTIELGGGCTADLDGDGDTDFDDLVLLLADYGCTASCSGDVDGDGDTDFNDLVALLGDYGCS